MIFVASPRGATLDTRPRLTDHGALNELGRINEAF